MDSLASPSRPSSQPIVMESPESPPPMDQQTLGCERTYTDSDELIAPIIAAESFHSCLSSSNLTPPEPDLSDSNSSGDGHAAGITSVDGSGDAQGARIVAFSGEDPKDIENDGDLDGSPQTGIIQTSVPQCKPCSVVDGSGKPLKEELQHEPSHNDNEAQIQSEYSSESSFANPPPLSTGDNICYESNGNKNSELSVNVISSNDSSVLEDYQHEVTTGIISEESKGNSRLDNAMPVSVEAIDVMSSGSQSDGSENVSADTCTKSILSDSELKSPAEVIDHHMDGGWILEGLPFI